MRVTVITGVAAALAGVARAQTPAVTYGFSGGAVRLSSTSREQGFGGLLQYTKGGWLTLAVNPALARAQFDTAGVTYTSTGLTDLPVSAAASHSFDDAFWSPELGLGLDLTLPTGNTACGLGSGQTSLGLDVGVGVSPVDPLSLSLSASRHLSGLSTASTLDAAEATSIDFDASYDLSRAVSAAVSFGADVGTADSGTALSRTVGAGVSWKVRGPLALTLDATHGLSAGSPTWALSIGIGTAFAGTNPVTPDNSLTRLKRLFTGGVGRGSGRGNIGGTRGGKTGTTTCS